MIRARSIGCRAVSRFNASWSLTLVELAEDTNAQSGIARAVELRVELVTNPDTVLARRKRIGVTSVARSLEMVHQAETYLREFKGSVEKFTLRLPDRNAPIARRSGFPGRSRSGTEQAASCASNA